jgi:hypothetical protein
VNVNCNYLKLSLNTSAPAKNSFSIISNVLLFENTQQTKTTAQQHVNICYMRSYSDNNMYRLSASCASADMYHAAVLLTVPIEYDTYGYSIHCISVCMCITYLLAGPSVATCLVCSHVMKDVNTGFSDTVRGIASTSKKHSHSQHLTT